MCRAGLDDANGCDSAHQSASAQDCADTKMASEDGWAGLGTMTGASWGGQGQDDDGLEWEPAVSAASIEPGSNPSPSLSALSVPLSDCMPASALPSAKMLCVL